MGELNSRKGMRVFVGARLTISASPPCKIKSTISCVHVVPETYTHVLYIYVDVWVVEINSGGPYNAFI